METAEKLSVTVTPAMARMIREKVEDGSFGSASEVIRAALRAFQREEEEHAERMASIRARVKSSIEDTRPNLSGKEVREQLKKFAEQYSSRIDDSAA
ncbi:MULTISPECIES: type II toxin-antitoxin system ParD family antitoxin [unclassified Mesorhizobium]|uniref:type II toxin-antitoxin system ParD family antitoxin n=2 Tax=Mesorhizobium TaxID=68287 RepID=UPI00112BF98A|nr:MULTISPECIES: type II toxin-antitoxin system ParD family antitoxin [unclassified Mesorhizobium]TPJ44573.1 type II toxin-antitoxin system ParD family antitoxin [Mesorhizobium sp. B2-6-6]MCA0000879.1 type II toxin-antitoxin system ParD family antitoxin [Mesorhizobium sp. B264B2A]MCA0004628.1 type II toxin-antitoxin system ParD family antitoxin [Mesorhizobium sp. B264B1B]MCA0020666.1 type II toxin-antitoxin system ParD family antitoxin [Mesorhizobium sp. B264B1A]TPK52852.1 type II toxin-antito